MEGGSCDGDSFYCRDSQAHFYATLDYTDMRLSSAVLPGLGVKQSQALQKISETRSQKCRTVIYPHYNVARSIRVSCTVGSWAATCVTSLPLSNRKKQKKKKKKKKKKKERNNITSGMLWVYLARQLNSWWCQIWFPAPVRWWNMTLGGQFQ